ncbi:MAG: hypothetical protein E6J91_16535 [Deltaproteobacteria bacterium]|nr:MAG: hypothetical protein E6J91_16535 [Deltaproteobacteria bacterium]
MANQQDTVDDTRPLILENHVKANDLLDRYPDIAELLRRQSFSYPINTKADFIEQMVAVSDTVVFRGVPYDTRFGAGLLPDFFFPLASEEDLVTKVAELLISRGLVPLG